MLRYVDFTTRASLATGLALILQPWWPGGVKAGFFVTAIATALHILTSHLLARNQNQR